MTLLVNKNLKWFWLIPLANLLVTLWSQSTFDAGDSILHYLHAKQSWQYPKYFLSHWSKPFFVLLASPFAQFGFDGIKVFNTLCVAIAVWFTWLIASEKSEHGWVVLLLLYASIEYFLSQGSGLTEPLFSAMMMMSIWSYLNKRITLSLLLASFLPFVRSEGWLVVPLFGFVAMLEGKYKSVPWLLTGHIVYAISGLFYYNDLLWMFHQNPYQGIEEKYGSGDLFHYIIQTPYMIGIPTTVLLVTGLLNQFFHCREIFLPQQRTRILLVYVVFLIFLIAHSLFWYYGIFHAFGMRRVFISVIPLMILIAFDGLLFLFRIAKSHTIKTPVLLLTCLLVVIFPFTKNKTAFNFKEDFQLDETQKTMQKVAYWLKKTEYKNRVVSYGHAYFSVVLEKDMDNMNEVISIDWVTTGNIPVGTIVLWDSFFSVNQMNVEKQMLEGSSNYKKLKEFRQPWKDGFFEVAVFEKIK